MINFLLTWQRPGVDKLAIRVSPRELISASRTRYGEDDGQSVR